jgi:hypothetical protein
MALVKVQKTIFEDSAGTAPADGAVCSVFFADSGMLATLYTTRSGVSTQPNPITTGADGLLSFYVEAGRYDIDVVHASGTQSYDDYLAVSELVIEGPRPQAEFSDVENMILASTTSGVSIDWSEYVGHRVTTYGYYTSGDGGGSDYVVGSDTPNGFNIIDLGGGFSATLQVGDEIDVKQLGAKGDNATDATNAFAAALLLASGKTLRISVGIFLISSTLSLDGLNAADIRFSSGGRIHANADNFVIFKSVNNAYGVKIFDADIRGNTHTGVTAFDCVRLEQVGAGIYRPVLRNLAVGIYLRSLCTGCKIESPDMNDVDAPIILVDPAGGVQINHPRIDTFTTNGIYVVGSGLYGCVGVQIIGGYIQNGVNGINDEGINTQILGTYFETCTGADIYFNTARFSFADATNHTSTGNVAFLSENSDGIKINHPFMSSSGRTIGLFDFDGTNTNCYADYEIGDSSENTPAGITTGLGFIPKAIYGSFTPTIEGATSAGSASYSLQYGQYRKIGKTVHIRLKVTYTGHTGTGSMVIKGVPVLGTINVGDKMPLFINGAAFTGPILAAGFGGSGADMFAYNYETTGAITLLSVLSAASVEINATYGIA